MGYKIGLGSQKGGVGKSTLARGLGAAFALSGWSVMLADLDVKQGTATAWQQRRLRAGVTPDVPVQMFGNVATAIAKTTGADLLIFDGAPHATADTVAIAQAVDLMILPTGLSLDDLEPTVTLANTLADKHGIDAARIVFALCKIGSSAAELDEARAYLGKTRFVTLDGAIPQKPAFSRAMDAGLSVIETPYKGPREQAMQLIQAAITKFESLI
ncbi:TPA: AAA family ATPase [Pseudomonas aeruginosa]|uniref:ParA family protein n=1 Tax=Pseudomonas aeruginosa TaxID=287 RepID=UPI00053E288E|nr:ParA family protein [Pseudomonas aeruginosa]EIU5460348.1 ParA family protein [Pseudomonas aeruginosa]EIU5543731.1 ParA family protein [Pseudomonas aeruginosa]EKW4494321.1 ParA family protein [Pseudomonas aeruginosa]EKY0078640.1 ParA family protein [Pseudomonas aeruginosa]EKY0500335.1 ParA family protein [Pseudomonas aeruginosa]